MEEQEEEKDLLLVLEEKVGKEQDKRVNVFAQNVEQKYLIKEEFHVLKNVAQNVEVPW